MKLTGTTFDMNSEKVILSAVRVEILTKQLWSV